MLRIVGLLLVLDLVWTHGLGPLFLSGPEAQQVLVRRRRANSFLEEMKQGNMERECVEERCSYEEAREIFENVQKTDEFWAKYEDGDACESRPCLNAGVCKDTLGGFTCFCQNGFQGASCELVIPELCENKNGRCEHFCDVVKGNVQCSCADGYFLSADERSCDSNELFKCGVVHTHHTRTIFRYERNQTTLNHTWANETDQDYNNTGLQASTHSLVHSLVHSLKLEQDQEQTHLDLGLDLDLNQDHEGPDLRPEVVNPGLALVQEEKITSQMASWTRIVNGEDCPPGECPWQALLMNEDNRGFCGGTILNEFIILTAAHCMNQSRYIYVVLGEFDTLVKDGNEKVHHVEKVLIHQKYKPDTYHNDIALIKLTSPVVYSKFIIPACLPTRDFAEKVLMREPDGLVSGFGRIGEFSRPSSILQRLAMPYVDRAKCLESTQFRISTRMFCAGYDQGGKDACQGDSGGPHVTRYSQTHFITGIVSWGEGCARKGKYGVYTQVSKYIGWIREGIRVLVPEKPGQKTGQNKTNRKKRSRSGTEPGLQQVFGPDQNPDQDPQRTGPKLNQNQRGFKVLYL